MATITIKKEEYDNLKALTASIPAVAGQVIKLIEKNEQLRKENKNLKDIIEDMGGLDSDEEEQGLRTCYECGKTSNMATITIKKEEYEKLMDIVSKIPAVSMWAVTVMEQRDAMEEELKEKEKELKNIYKKLSEDREDEIKQDITMSDWYSSSDEEEPNKCDKCGDESYKYSTELCEALGDGYYCHDCITNS